MKKILSIVLALCLLLGSSAILTASAATKDFGVPVAEETEQEIYNQFVAQNNITDEDRLYFGILGEFDGNYFILGIYDFALTNIYEPVGKYHILGGCGGAEYCFYVYSNGEFISLKSAYQSGLVSDEIMDLFIGRNNEQLNKFIYRLVFLIGDIDEDGAVSVSDVVALRENIISEKLYYSYDVDGDNKITVSDVVALRKLIMKG